MKLFVVLVVLLLGAGCGAEAVIETQDAGQENAPEVGCGVIVDGAVCFCDETTCRCPSQLPASYAMCAPAPHVGCGYPRDLTRSQICYPIDGRMLCEEASDASVWCAQ